MLRYYWVTRWLAEWGNLVRRLREAEWIGGGGIIGEMWVEGCPTCMGAYGYVSRMVHE